MSDLCDRCPHRFQTLRRIVLALERGCRIVRCSEEECFSLWCIDPSDRVSLRKTILESGTKVVSFPGADALPCLLGSGDDEKIVKDGMCFIPPSWFRDKPEWERLGREGLCYPVYFMVALKETRHAHA